MENSENSATNEIIESSTDENNVSTENSTEKNNTTPENTQTSVEVDPNAITLEDIHTDLGVIASFIILFSVCLLVKYIYKFFRMFF